MGFKTEFNWVLKLKPENGLNEKNLKCGRIYSFSKNEKKVNFLKKYNYKKTKKILSLLQEYDQLYKRGKISDSVVKVKIISSFS